MIVPLLFAGLLAIVGYKLGQDKKFLVVKTGAMGPPSRPGFTWVPNPGYWMRTPKGYVTPASPISILDKVVSQNGQPTPQQITAALTEAITTGNQAIEQLIYQLFGYPQQQFSISGDGQLAVGAESPPEAMTSVEDWGESANPSQFQVPVSTPQTSPIPGLPLDGWCALVKALKTKKPTFASEKHLGAYEHNRKRLAKLGLSKPTDERGQYQALCADLADLWSDGQALVNGFAGSVVEIAGVKTLVTKSGVLGLMKAAGLKGAESWLTNSVDRAKYPRTTETFSRCNGCF